jgi:hypothetical protein
LDIIHEPITVWGDRDVQEMQGLPQKAFPHNSSLPLEQNENHQGFPEPVQLPSFGQAEGLCEVSQGIPQLLREELHRKNP